MQDQLKYHIAGYVLNDRIYESSQSVIYKGKNLTHISQMKYCFLRENMA